MKWKEAKGSISLTTKESVFHKEALSFKDGLPYSHNGSPIPIGVKISDLFLGLLWQYAPPSIDLHMLYPADFDEEGEVYPDRMNVGDICAPRIHQHDYPLDGFLVEDSRIGYIQSFNPNGTVRFVKILGGERFVLTQQAFNEMQNDFHHHFVKICRGETPVAVMSHPSEIERISIQSGAFEERAVHARWEFLSMFEYAHRNLPDPADIAEADHVQRAQHYEEVLNNVPTRGFDFQTNGLPWDFLSHMFESSALQQCHEE
ncbi:hypothetical protein OCU04_013196 [Sclerotinia nivalis]|uniref:Uncharacterized protein n=1 Tax=Sclerotinia nivalis TaxID=352851 RepID=A0A9X0DDY6_9HELO|nr:hypothetical protein OCU04_013196 [Sclerotinia nivalis]